MVKGLETLKCVCPAIRNQSNLCDL